MTKSEFLNNCRELISEGTEHNQGVTKKFLTRCYDNIVHNEIKVSYDYMEKLYMRIQANEVSSVKVCVCMYVFVRLFVCVLVCVCVYNVRNVCV